MARNLKADKKLGKLLFLWSGSLSEKHLSFSSNYHGLLYCNCAIKTLQQWKQILIRIVLAWFPGLLLWFIFKKMNSVAFPCLSCFFWYGIFFVLYTPWEHYNIIYRLVNPKSISKSCALLCVLINELMPWFFV